MLIKALCDYYDLKTQKNRSSLPDGYEMQAVHFQILLRENGEIAGINPYTDSKEIPLKNGKMKIVQVPREIALPERSKKTGIYSAIIEHRPLYIFGLNCTGGAFSPDDEKNKARKSHESFVKRNLGFFDDLNSPICSAYRNFIASWNPEEQCGNEALKSIGKNYQTAYFSFALYGDVRKTPQDDPQFIEKFQRLSKEKNTVEGDAFSAVCPIVGEYLPTARIHDKIKFPGGNTSGCVFVGMKEPAYESYGKKQSYNSNISEEAMKKYTAAFNELLADQNHRIILNNMTIIFFALKNDDSAEADFFSKLMGNISSGDEDTAFREAMKNMKNGKAVEYSALGIDKNVDFYAAGFTPNSSRICQKFLVHNRFGKIMDNFAQHQRDFAVDESSGRQVFFSSIAKELVSPKATKDEVPPPLMTELIRAAAEGVSYPEEMLKRVVTRIKTDRNEEKNHFIKFNPTRVGIVKACLNRKARKSNKEEEIQMSLNKNETNPAYLCGRLFAALEKIQQDASGGNLNTTICDSYFSSACSRPAAVFPRLIELSNHHLRKLDAGLCTSRKKLLGEIMDKMDTAFPSALSLDDQGRFAVGYYHQNQDFYTKKNNENE